ncbi:MAG: hypothetical protein LHW45_05080 [Candidatus Cloacimonetes bacterium]|nr:hypothetical protein [Candidatus Cloacimonadota bacterium]MDY0366985.1 hypothetical protein [Candidatus Syntrophosphaera sp.]
MKSLLVFTDEAFNADKSYSQISGFLITPSQYIRLRNEVLSNYAKKHEERTGQRPMRYLPGYHSSDFCPELNDHEKFKVWDYLLKKIYSYAEIVFIHGVHSTHSFSNVIPKGKEGYLGDVWFNHLCYLNSYAEKNFIIPIIDLGLNKSYSNMYQMYSGSHNNLMGAVVTGYGTIDCIKNFGNILEPVFCKDEYSIGVQMADLVGAFQWTNSKLYPSESRSWFKTKAASMFLKYIKRRKTNCLFYTISYDTISKQASNTFHDSFIAGKKILNESHD